MTPDENNAYTPKPEEKAAEVHVSDTNQLDPVTAEHTEETPADVHVSDTLSSPGLQPKRIQRLAPGVADKIAAGEVVERPSAVVKELVENAIDAGAMRIVVEIEQGGKKYIRVTDDGCGLNPEDVPLAFERHATSKVTEITDLVHLSTLGFRGEALSSIAAVSYLDMTTRRSGDAEGIHIALAGGRETVRKASSASQGTTVIVKDLFFNTPARLKFMKSSTTEAAYISDLMSKLALSHPERSFQFVLDKRLVFKTPGDNKAFSAIYATLERALAKSMFEFQFGNDLMRVHGWASKIEYNRGNRNYQMTFVNGRYVKSRTMLDAIQYAYQGLLPSARFPAVILYLEISPDTYDVNIHPQKTEIKFEREDAIKNFLSVELKRALQSLQQVPVKTFSALPVGSAPNVAQTFGTSPGDAVFSGAGNRPDTDYAGAIRERLKGDSNGPGVGKRPINPMFLPYNGIFIGQNRGFGQEASQAVSSETSESTATKSGRQEVYTSTPMTFDTSLLENLRLPEEDFSAALAPESTPNLPKETLYDNARYVGQVFKSFLLYEKDDHMLWIDQHAAHEKVLYESFKNAYEKREVVRQILVEPILIECDTMTALRLSERTEALERIGFTIESFGETDFILREVPMLFDIPGTKRFFETLKDHLGDLRQAAQKPIEDRLMTMACKAAVKSNDALTPFEAAQLIKSLRGLDSPYTCPHGRPLVVKVERSEIEKKFLRT